MTIKEFSEMVADGIHPVIEFLRGIEDFNGYARKGMRATIVGAAIDGAESEANLKVDFSGFDSFNLQFEKVTGGLTARQSGHYRTLKSYMVDLDSDTDAFFTVLDPHSIDLYIEYVRTGSQLMRDPNQSYVRWLESKVKLLP